jgi:hypothetical protein
MVGSGDSFRKKKVDDNKSSGKATKLNESGSGGGSGQVGSMKAGPTESEEIVCLFKIQHKLFSFRSKHIPVGQYEFPFTFKLPSKLPSSFHFVNQQGENYEVKYTVTCAFDDEEPLMHYEKEIIVLQTTEDLEKLKRKRRAQKAR